MHWSRCKLGTCLFSWVKRGWAESVPGWEIQEILEPLTPALLSFQAPAHLPSAPWIELLLVWFANNQGVFWCLQTDESSMPRLLPDVLLSVHYLLGLWDVQQIPVYSVFNTIILMQISVSILLVELKNDVFSIMCFNSISTWNIPLKPLISSPNDNPGFLTKWHC